MNRNRLAMVPKHFTPFCHRMPSAITFAVLSMLLLDGSTVCPVAASSMMRQHRTVRTGHHSSSSSDTNAQESCKADKLTVYRVVLTTHWTRETFPKQYPEFRPHAQWSKVVGRSHDKSYVLWRLGTEATDGVKIFAETGKSDVLDAQTQGEGGIYDEFTAPPTPTGAGKTEAEFFVDGNHSRVSLMSRIIPSPDWFIGIDSLSLCEQGGWVDSLTFEVDPIDAGTDNGFTFTAPNWSTDPKEKIYRISALYPNHPANSFYYPKLKRLPPLATFKFIKVKEYELSQVFYHDDDTASHNYYREESEDDVSNVIHVLQNDADNVIEKSATSEPTVTEPTPKPIAANSVGEPTTPYKTSSKKHIVNDIVTTYDESRRTKNKKGTKQRRGPRHCRTSDWSDWTPCSKTCGIGESTRTRTVLKHPRRGGKACPPLQEIKWCGSARACKGKMDHYFNW